MYNKINVILPAYNEGGVISLLLKNLDFSLQKTGLSSEIVVVNDGSTDNTVECVRNFSGGTPVILINQDANRGLSKTIKNAFFTMVPKCGNRDIVIVMDADNTHSPDLILQMIKFINEGYHIVIASRYQKGAMSIGLSCIRKILSYGASFLFRAVVRIKGARDYTCGYRAYRADLLKSAIEYYGQDFIKQPGFGCMAEILLKLKRFNPSIKEVPLVLRYDYKKGQSKMKVCGTIGDTLGMLLDYLRGSYR